MPFGNVNVAYTPCKSVGQLKSVALYMLGKKPEQVRNGTKKHHLSCILHSAVTRTILQIAFLLHES